MISNTETVYSSSGTTVKLKRNRNCFTSDLLQQSVFLVVPWVGLLRVIVVIPDYTCTDLLFKVKRVVK